MTSEKHAIRVLLAKPGIDGHDTGIRVVAQALRDAGMEVIYIGMRRTAEEIVRISVQEGVDVVGLSFHSPVHKELTRKIVSGLREKNANPLVVVGGLILKDDIPVLKEIGAAGVFPFESRLNEIVSFIQDNVKV